MHWLDLIMVPSSICTLILESICVFNVIRNLFATSDNDRIFAWELLF